MKKSKDILTKEEMMSIKTGIEENIPNTEVNFYTKRNYPKNIPEFIMLFQKISEKMIDDLSPSANKVLMKMLCKLQYGNYLPIDQLTISEECKMCLKSANSAIKELKDLNILIVLGDLRDKRRKVYYINPHNAWKGTIQGRTRTIKAIEKSKAEGQLTLPFDTFVSNEFPLK